ncbi:MAG: carboxymuconolactone decarboxylase family protein [Candidatus Bathyarchaeota archaeon]|nr:carboxymuconolactone decarboxylase family protein [Candidatus Bathyarchaeota archaeon]
MIKYIHPVKEAAAEGLVAQVYAQIKRDFGRVAEPFLIHSPLPKLLAGAWMVCRECELVGNVPRAVKEAVASAVSQLNRCPYCVDAHTIMLTAAGEHNTAGAISKTQYDAISDAQARMMVDWALATTSPRSEALRWLPFSRQEAPEIIGTAVFYHYMNRMANVLLGDTPLPSNQRWLRNPMKRVARWMFTGAVNRPKSVGESLMLLPKADLPNDLRWAKPSANVAWAYASFAAAVEEVGEQVLPVEVRAFVLEELSEWSGTTSELSLAWSEDAISSYSEENEAAARLALLTALAPYRIAETDVLDFRKYFPEDQKLVGTLAWASFAAAKRIGTWLQHTTKSTKGN